MYNSYMYRCVFMMDGDRMEICGETAFEFQKGFWLNEDYKADGGWLTGTYWIPAHQIIFIKKEIIERIES